MWQLCRAENPTDEQSAYVFHKMTIIIHCCRMTCQYSILSLCILLCIAECVFEFCRWQVVWGARHVVAVTLTLCYWWTVVTSLLSIHFYSVVVLEESPCPRTSSPWQLGMCGKRISVQFRFLKTRTEPNRSQKVNPKISVSVAFLELNLSHTNSQYLSHSRKAFKEVYSEIWYYIYTTQDSGMIGIIYTNTIWFKIKFKLNFLKHAFETSWAFRKQSTKMQNPHTRKTAYTFFLYFTTDLQRKPNRPFFQNRNRTKPAVFLKKNKTEPKPKRAWKIHSAHPYWQQHCTYTLSECLTL